MADQPAARVVRSRSSLAMAIAQWPQGAAGGTTWALVAVGEVPSAPELAALRHAAKVCDCVAAVVIPKIADAAAQTLPALPSVLRAAGCDVAYIPAAEKGLLSLHAQDGSSLKLLLQALLAVLPSVVVVSKADAIRARQWRLLEAEFGGVVEIMMV